MENNLFSKGIFDELVAKHDNILEIDDTKLNAVQKWTNMLKNGELTDEIQNYGNFQDIILRQLLGYSIDDIKTNYVTEGNESVEFVLYKNGEAYVAVELKGSDADFSTYRNHKNETVMQQAIRYATSQRSFEWCIVSNYDEFIFFNKKSRKEFISFKFDELNNESTLKKFLFVFSKVSLIDMDLPSELSDKTLIIERNLEDEFYQLYSETRLMLIKELENSSQDIDRIEAINLAQLILNRFIFLCFAEDKGLIRPQTIFDVMLTPIEHNNLFEFTMWDRLNELFRFADKGNEEKGITAFNGGLFEKNLRHLEIRDKVEDVSFFDDCRTKWTFNDKYDDIESKLGVYKDTLNPIYKNLLTISSFDFASEVSVNILGHIFENSISDIEELKEDNTEQRKKDGVFYTPEYITDYICRNTIIPYLSLSGDSNSVPELISEYESANLLDELDNKLKNIKIIDPACGSGSMLNKSVDILFEIHEALHDSKYANDPSLNPYIDSLESRKQIISNNIYGVDLNEESVEITKLSLFLKLATGAGVKQGFKLPNLDKNIKCGNSLIDDENIVGNKAFNWKTNFYDEFNEGGFDIVVGNPPYVRADYQDDEYQEQRKFLKESENYETLYEKWDLYVAFIEKGLKILKKGGYLSYIISNSYNTSKFSLKSKKFIDDNFTLKQLDFFINMEIFKGVGVENLIMTVQNIKSDKLTKRIVHENTFDNISLLKETDDLNKIYKTEDPLELDMYFDNSTLLGDICYISKGMVLNAHESFAKGEFKKNDLISNTKNEINSKPYIEGKDLKKYKVERIRFLEWDTDRVPSKVSRPTFPELYLPPKLIRSSTNQGIYDKIGLMTNHSCYIFKSYNSLNSVNNKSIISSIKKWSNKSREELEEISCEFDLKYIQAILNSNLSKYYLNTIRSNRIEYYTSPDELKLMPIKNISLDEQKSFCDYVDKMITLNDNMIEEISSFKKWLRFNFNIEELSPKIEKFYELDEDSFLKELNKKLKTTSKPKQDLIRKQFNESTETIEKLKNEIKALDDLINTEVYKLYNVSEEDINEIENSLSK